MKTRTAALLFALALGALAQTKKVVITSEGTWYFRLGPSEVAELQAASPKVRIVVPAKDQVMQEIADADGIIGAFNGDMLQAAKNLKWVQVTSAGVEQYLTPQMKASNVALTNAKIVQGPEIADHAFALLLALTRQLNMAIPDRQREEWRTKEYRPVELKGRTAVIVGVGGIGTQIAVRANAFGMKAIGVDARDLPMMPFLERSVPPDRLDDVLAGADVLFTAAPWTAQTDRMIGARQFSLLKKGAYFIAVSRGKLYDMNALVSALESKHLAGAGVDVTDTEPLPKGHPLWKFDNVVITPHIAGRSDGEHARYMALYKENLRRFGNGEPLLNVVDKQKGY